MPYVRQLDVNDDLQIYRYLDGIRLIKPNLSQRYDSSVLVDINLSVGELFQLPVNVVLLNQDSVIQNINESNAATVGFVSIHSALGKTIRSVYQSPAADFSIHHDKKVISSRHAIIEEEHCVRKDSTSFTCITGKMPWYDENNNVIGILGCSVALGLNDKQDIHASMSSFNKLGLLSSLHGPNNIFTILNKHKIFLTKRELEILRLTIRGLSAKTIAERIALSHRTIESYLENIKYKFSVTTKEALIEKIMDKLINI